MRWKPEYDRISQPGMLNRPEDNTLAVYIPVWFYEYLSTHKSEDIDPVITTRLLLGYLKEG